MFIHILNLRFTNEYLVDNIPNEQEPKSRCEKVPLSKVTIIIMFNYFHYRREENHSVLSISFKHAMLLYIYICASGVMVMVVGNGHDELSSNPGQDWLHFT